MRPNPRRPLVLTVLVTAALAVGVAACGGDPERSAAGSAPSGTWVLDQEASGMFDFGVPVRVDATFADGRVSGSGGCNRYSGPFTVADDGSVTVGELATTRMMCTPEASGIEGDYLGRLAAAESVTEQGGTLRITNAVGDALVLRR